MKRTLRLIFVITILLTACSQLPSSITINLGSPTNTAAPAPTQVAPPTQAQPIATVAPPTAAPFKPTVAQPTAASPTSAPKSNQPMVYISGTTHIETNRQSWPNPEAFINFLRQVTTAGMKWSVGADIGWLEGEARAGEIIKTTEAMGVEWDIHAHKTEDRPKNVVKIKNLGGKPNTVISGLVLTELEQMRSPFKLSDGGTWFGDILWGFTLRPDHSAGSEDTSTGLWKPKSSKEFYTHDPNGSIIMVGGGTRDLKGAENLAKSNPKFAVKSATIMVNPVKLVVIDMDAKGGIGTDGINEIKSFAERMSKLSNARFATISQTAKAWVEAGSVVSGSQVK